MDNIPRIGDDTANYNTHSDVPDNTDIPKSHEQEKYSIEQFKKDYIYILKNNVFPKLEQFNELQKQSIAKVKELKIGVTLFIGIYIVSCILFKITLQILFILGVYFIFTRYRSSIKKKLENEIKSRIAPILIQAFPGFSWTLEPIITKSEPEEAGLYIDDIEGHYKTDDNFKGSYRGVEIAITECRCSDKNGLNIFQGPIIRIKMNKNFEGVTILRPYNNSTRLTKLEEIKLEDVEFNKQFKVFSTDQIEARYLLTTAFMERLKRIMLAFKTEKIYCSFYKDYVYIGPYTNNDLFSIADLSESLTDEKQYEVLFEEFASILELVDHFKLDKKLGL